MLVSLTVAVRAAKTLLCELVSAVNVPCKDRNFASMPSKAACCVVTVCFCCSRLVIFCCSTATSPLMMALVLRPLTRPLTENELVDDELTLPPDEMPDKVERELMIG